MDQNKSEIVELNVKRKQKQNEANIINNETRDKIYTKEQDFIDEFHNLTKDYIKRVAKAGINAKSAQIDRGDYVEFIVRISKEKN